ncbi:MAG: M23 family metallopeptidase, partial [Fibrobacter sp.]|nr:M23 family metallopeptidase [Fibrobacter sp.]
VELECKNRQHLEEGISVLQEYLNFSIHNFYCGTNGNVFLSSERKIIDIVTELFSRNTANFSKLLYQSFINIFSAAPSPTLSPVETIVPETNSENLSFVCPVLGRISSHFGLRADPVYEGTAIHKGIDIATNIGSKVSSAADGTVLYAGNKNRWGNVIIIDHKETGYQTIYAHLSSIVIDKGKTVKAGQTIGYVGNTGKTTGPHLHYEIRYNGKALDPLPFLVPADILAD